MNTAVNPSDVSPPPENRRRTSRQQFVTKAMLYRDNRAAGPQRMLIKDVSMLGFGGETAAPVEPGTRCMIVIEAGPNRLRWRAKVVCCGKIDSDLYRIGCEFVPAERSLFNLSDNDLDLTESEGAPVLILQ